jgi:hypothetical protein
MGSMQRYAATVLGAGAVVLAFGAFAPAAAQAAAPTTLYVSQGGLDTGTCPSANPCGHVSYALNQAAPGATIEVSGTIDDHMTISSPVTITTWAGGPAGSPAVLDGTHIEDSNGIVNVRPSAAGVTLNDLTIENGTPGLINFGTLTLTDSTVSGNAGYGNGGYACAGVCNIGGTMTILDSTVAQNPGGNGYIGGIYNSAMMTVIASTVSGNTGGGIFSNGTATLGATIVANNTGGNCSESNAANIVSAGYNLTDDTSGAACSFNSAHDSIGKNPQLGHLASNGGPTQTMLPSTKSPAANVIPKGTTLHGVAVCPSTDQRGVTRPGRGHPRCTIGAAEVGFKNPTTTSITVPATATFGTNVVYLAVVTSQSGTGVPAGTITFTTGATTLCTAVLSGGVAACGATTAPVGTDTVTGTYSGGGGYASSSATATLTVTSG